MKEQNKMKKQNILLVLKILETESDKEHPITQLKIADIISDVYSCDRKNVGRNIAYLIKIGYPIVKTSKGFYLDNKIFTLDERNIILSAIREKTDITQEQKEQIISKLDAILTKIYMKKENDQ